MVVHFSTMTVRIAHRIDRPDGNDVIRFMFVSLYFIFMVPAMFGIRRLREGQVHESFVTISITVLALFFIAEVIEFAILRYRREKRVVSWSLFLLRVGAIASYWYVFPRNDIPLRHNPVVSSMIPLIVFYAFFLMKRRWSILVLLATIVPIAIDYATAGASRSVPGPDQLGFLVFRTVVIVFFYLLAWFWDTERIQSQENRRLLTELHASQRQLRQYATDLGKTVALEERTRLARDIHDNIGHSLTAIGIQLTKALAYFDVDTDQSRQAVTAAHTTAKDAMSDVRESIGSLNGDTEGINLKESAARLAKRLEDTGVAVTNTFHGVETRYNYAVLLGLYRFLQEATTNILKHAAARCVTIEVDLGNDRGTARVSDDGVGFDVTAIDRTDSTAGDRVPLDEQLGLPGLQRRFELIGGTIEISSHPSDDDSVGSGTTLVAKVPRDPLILIGRDDDTDTRIDR